jgi:pimeloyl-ACP methyl ester carboxylesterase
MHTKHHLNSSAVAARLILLFISLLFSIGISLESDAQQRGNIVEYFGREVIDRIDEGSVVHIFSEGLTMPTGPVTGGVLPSRDIIAWHLAQGTLKQPAPGSFLQEIKTGEDSVYVWSPVKANDENVFDGRNLRRGYLYTSLRSSREEVVLLDAKGHTRVYINGLPYEGDHYDFGYTLIPVKLKKGLNEFIYTHGRFGRVASKLVSPKKPVMLTLRDMTLPSLVIGEDEEKWAAIRVINTTDKNLIGLKIKCILESGEESEYQEGNVMPMSVRKLKFLVPPARVGQESATVKATVILSEKDGKEIDRTEITLNRHRRDQHHERTFISQIDGSVQYYSISPSLKNEPGQALVLSVHGAGVEARNQARAYKQKDWCHIVAPTNRRPFGFNWEEWGRIDGKEVLAEAKRVFQTKPELTYLTGHSMGGHGTWHLGVTFPDHFAAIAPCASYPDILGYRRDGTTPGFDDNKHFNILRRSANGGRTLSLKRNFLQSGVYILHGDDDTVVPVSLARAMRQTLGEFHPNFTYYEYPGGSHWYGDHSVDWHPIFSYFKWHTIPSNNEIKNLEFHTASPGISASNYWITVWQQEKPLEFSAINFTRNGDTIQGKTTNVSGLKIHLSLLSFEKDPVIVIEDQVIRDAGRSDIYVEKNTGVWKIAQTDSGKKHPARNGGFKMAFNNQVVLVYATGGNREENEWYLNKARYDADAFLYKANGSIEVIADRDFKPEAYPDRNVVLYGNADNNSAWSIVLSECPVTVSAGKISFGERSFTGDDLGTYFIYPRKGSATASVGVVAGTGLKGMKAAMANDYFSGVNGYPDLLIFNHSWLNKGLYGIQVSGFFDNNWQIGPDFF